MTEPVPTAEAARALLWRHGLPEDVIDGALALFAQELAGKIRAWHDRLPGGHECCDGNAADLISPENWARHVPDTADEPAPAAPLSEEQLAAQLAPYEAAARAGREQQHATIQAETLREEADRIRAHCPDHLDSSSASDAWMVCHCAVADDMQRRLADAASGPGGAADETQTETQADGPDAVAAIVDALQKRAGELSELAEEEMRPSLEERAQEWHEAVDVARRAARAVAAASVKEERAPFMPPAHYRGRDGTAYCVHAIPVGPDSCRECRDLAEQPAAVSQPDGEA